MAKRKQQDDQLVDVTQLELTPPPAEGKVRKPVRALADMTIEERIASSTPSMHALGVFMQRHVERWTFPPFLAIDPKTKSPRRDLKIFGDFIKQWGLPVVLELIETFFSTTDPRVTRCNYSATDFQYHAPRLRMAQAGGGSDISDKTASNVHEISKAMGRKP